MYSMNKEYKYLNLNEIAHFFNVELSFYYILTVCLMRSYTAFTIAIF